MAKYLGQHAVVLGGSMAGLMTARVLADYFHHQSEPLAHRYSMNWR